jgi:hypothetical protein
MECKKINNQFTEYLENSLSEVANSDVKSHLNSCVNCTKELEEMKSFLLVLDSQEMEVPSKNLRSNFKKMLAQEVEKNQPKVLQLQPKTDWKSYLRVAASVLLIVSAFMLGKYQSNSTSTFNKQQKVLALLEDSSASKRILAVTNAENFSEKDTKIIDALINRLLFDKNTNVRLAAADALSKFSSKIMVRDAFIKSLETDINTSVQIEVITILAEIQEKRAVKSMRKMLENEETPQYVKQQLQLNLSSLL